VPERTGSALELGVGTGRLAAPLSGRGVRVHGIDLSRAMVAELRAQPGGDNIGVTIELDLMARIAGMKLCQRWANWRPEPFTRDSTAHISVWEKT
jgi:SAM-dependent methyltransferase